MASAKQLCHRHASAHCTHLGTVVLLKLPKQAIVVATIIGAAVIIAITLFALRPSPEQQEVASHKLLIDVAIAHKQSLTINVHSQGTVQPHTETSLVAEVSGQVMEVSRNFENGSLVEKGEILLHIDDRTYRAELKRAEAAVATAHSNLLQEKGRAAVAREDLKKYPRRHANEDSRALALRLPQLNEAKARLNSALADRRQAEINLERTKIRAPYRGMIKARQVDLGQFVATGSALGQIFSVDTAEVRLPVPSDRLAYLQLPDPRDDSTQADVILENDIGERWPAKLVRNEGILDERSRVLFVVAQIADPYRLDSDGKPLRNGSFVKADIQGRSIADLVAIPRHILRTGNQLWVVDENDTLRNRDIKALRTEGKLVYVYEGLESGDRICLSSVPSAISGTAVKINTSLSTAELVATPSAELATINEEPNAP